YWERETGSPIPLGGIVSERSLDQEIKHKVKRLIRKSVEVEFPNPKSGLDYIRCHAQEMEDSVVYKRLELYVNAYSVNIGSEGRQASQQMFDKAVELGVIPPLKKELFLTRA